MLHSLWLPRGCINSKHCLPLCATGLEVGDNSVEKNVIFKNNPFPLNNAISRLFPVYSGCEISDARAFVTGFKGVSNNKGKLHPQTETTHFQTFVISCKFPCVLFTTKLVSVCTHFHCILCLLTVKINRMDQTFVFYKYETTLVRKITFRMRKEDMSLLILGKQ